MQPIARIRRDANLPADRNRAHTNSHTATGNRHTCPDSSAATGDRHHYSHAYCACRDAHPAAGDPASPARICADGDTVAF